MRRLALLLALCSLPAAAQAPGVAKMLGLFARLQAPQQPFQFEVTDAEINEYMRHALRVTPRPGLDSVQVKIFPNNYISTFTVIDFDAVERWKPGTVPALLRPVLNGKKAVWVAYRFQTENGAVTFSVEKAYFQKIRLPAFFVEKMIEIVAARQPEKYDTTKPVPLPYGLRRIRTREHVATGGR